LRNFYLALACSVALMLAIPVVAQTKAAPTKSAAPSGAADKEKIETLYQAYVKAFKAKDVNAIMSFYDPNELFVFDVMPPREYASWAAYKKDWEGLFTSNPGRADVHLTNLEITVVGLVAYAHNIQTAYFTGADGSRLDVSVRVTDVLRKVNGKWLIVQEHVSVPVDLATGKGDLASKP
jgi:ketosteroid isomerase-like protein